MLLALDTATATASIALYDLAGARLHAEMTWLAHRRHTQDLMTTVQSLLRQQQVAPEQLTALAVTTGPGSFTGVRIAISAAKGIGLGLPTPPRAIGLPTLCVTAAPWLALAGQHPAQPAVCAYIQAGRGRYNWTSFAAGDLLRRPEAEAHQSGSADELAYSLGETAQPHWLVGELDATLSQAVAGLRHVFVFDAVSGLRRAGQLARVAAEHLDAGHFDDLRTIQPLYLRNP